MRIWLITLLFFCANTWSVSTEFDVGGVKLGNKLSDLEKHLPKGFTCTSNGSDKNSEMCRLSSCSYADPKCNLWGSKVLGFVRAAASMKDKKVVWIRAELDYLNVTMNEVRKVLAELEKHYGKPSFCPLKAFLDDPEKKKLESVDKSLV